MQKDYNKKYCIIHKNMQQKTFKFKTFLSNINNLNKIYFLNILLNYVLRQPGK